MGRFIDDGNTPRGVGPKPGRVASIEGRSELGIATPTYLHDIAQRTHSGMSEEITAHAVELGIDEEIAHQLGILAETAIGLRHFQNSVDAGYAARVLEERAGLEPLLTTEQVAEKMLREAEQFDDAVTEETRRYHETIAAENNHYAS